jgi:hypothetical protein
MMLKDFMKKAIQLLTMPANTYRAKIFRLPLGDHRFTIAGRIEGGIDFAVPQGRTYLLTVEQAAALAAALNGAVEDVAQNCRYGKDALLRSART